MSNLRDDLLAATEHAIATAGIENVSLRAVSAAVGKSTTVVFQNFGSKEGLLLAAAEVAVAKVTRQHADLRALLADMPQNPSDLASVIAFYVIEQSRDPANRLLLEALFKRRHLPQAAVLLQRWDAMRRAFWQARLEAGQFAALAPVIATYSIAEQGFACALSNNPGYAMLLRDTLTALFEGCEGTLDPDRGATPAIAWMAERATLPGPDATRSTVPAMERLLEHAAATILAEGVTGLNLRALAAAAGVAPSLIIYHYGDVASFTKAAIWRAMIEGLPRSLDATASAEPPRSDGWRDELERATHPAGNGTPAGFYVNYARILGQLGLSASRDPDLLPLVLQLRAIEGVGIHRASHATWPPALRLGRANAAAFAIWIKGRAILNEALDPIGEAAETVAEAAAALAEPHASPV